MVAEEFIDRILVGTLHAAAVVVGANFRSAQGRGRRGHLVEAGATRDFETVGVASTAARRSGARPTSASASPPVTSPAPPRRFDDRHRAGGRRGGQARPRARSRRPTCRPADGRGSGRRRVAGSLTRLDTGIGTHQPISVGTNPAFDGERDRRVESYVLDRDDLELYGVEVEVAFVDRLREMVKLQRE